MRHLLFLLFLVPLLSFGQASTIFSGQGTPQDTSANNYVWVGASYRLYVAKMDSLRIKYHNVKTWFPDTMAVMRNNVNLKLAKADTTGKWKPVGWFPTWTQVTSKPSFSTVSVTGDYNDLINKPTLKRIESYSGTTNSSGLYTVTYGTAYSVTPNVQFNINGGAVTNTIRLTASSTTGFTVYVQNRVDVVGLLPSYNNVNGAIVDILVTER